MPRSSSPLARATAWLAVGLLLGMPPGVSFAGPTGEDVVRGEVSIERDGTLTEIVASDGAIIEFESFDIRSDETVRFLQPYEAARVLNRILGPDPTRIDGSLLANGHVYIVNPAGVFFGGEAIIDVAGLVAAAGNLSNEDFLAGIDRFTELRGPIENRGSIEAGSVTLVGRSVANHGAIRSHGGMIAMLAGENVLLASLDGRVVVHVDSAAQDPGHFGVENHGTLDAGSGRVQLTAGDVYSLAVNHTGITRARDAVFAGGGLVRVAGEIDARGEERSEVGGRVHLLGDEVEVVGARVDASGAAGGGEIRVGGDVRGGGDLRQATRTRVDEESELVADALEEGDGGDVVVWARGRTEFAGHISARGGARGGDGGFAEVSGKQGLLYRGLADLGAPAGGLGDLLIDPENLRVTDGETGEPDTISAEAIELQSETANVTLEADNDVVIEDLADDVLDIRDGRSITIVADADVDAVGGFEMEGLDDAIRTRGGDVSITAGDGVTVSNIDTTGPDGLEEGLSGVQGGGVTIAVRGGDVLVRGDITTRGGDGDAFGGGGGTVSITGFGSARVAGTIDASGGDGRTELGGDAAAGFDAITVSMTDGSVEVGAIVGTGGDGASGGFGAGIFLDARTTPSDEEGMEGEPGIAADITVTGDIDVTGGAGTAFDGAEEDATFFGGSGGFVSIATEDAVAFQSIDTSGGAGVDSAGSAGAVLIGQGLASGIETTGTITARGGDSERGDGGAGAAVTLDSNGGAIRVGDVDTGGGSGERGGVGAIVTIDQVPMGQFSEEPGDGSPGVETGRITTAGGGSAGDPEDLTRNLFGATGGDVVIRARDRSVLVDGGIDTSGGVGRNGDGDAGDVEIRVVFQEEQPGIEEGDPPLAPEGPGGDVGVLGSIVAVGGRVSTDPAVVIEATKGSISLTGTDPGTGVAVAIDTSGTAGSNGLTTTFDGGRGGDVALGANGDVTVQGAIVARGGDGTSSRRPEPPEDMDGEEPPEPTFSGGDGGRVELLAVGGTVRVGDVDTAGGSGEDAGLADPGEVLDAAGLAGGIEIAARRVEPDMEPAVGGDVELAGTLAASIGDGDVPEGTERAGVRVAADGAVSQTGAGPAVSSTERVTLEGGTLGSDATPLLVETRNPAPVTLERPALEIVHTSTAGSVDVAHRYEGSAGTDSIEIDPDGPGAARVSNVDTTATGVELEVRLAAVESETGEGDPVFGDLVLGAGAARLGGRTTFASEGDLAGEGAAAQIETSADLVLEATAIGADGAPVRVDAAGADGSDAELSLRAAGDVRVSVDRAGFAAIALTQRDGGASADVTHGDSDVVEIEGTELGGLSQSRIVRVDTTDTDVHFAYSLEDVIETEVVTEVDGEEVVEIVVTDGADLFVEGGAMTLGGDAVLRSTRDVVLGPGGSGTPVALEGGLLALEADANGDGAGSVSMADTSDALELGGGSLLVVSGDGVGRSFRPIRTVDLGALAGETRDGGFFVRNEAGGDVAVTALSREVPGADAEIAAEGVSAVGDAGEVGLVNEAGSIVLDGELEGPHVETSGSQTLDADLVALASRESRLAAGGDLVITGAVRSNDFGSGVAPEDATSFTASAGGEIRLDGGAAETSGDQTWDGDLSLSSATRLESEVATVDFTGDVSGPGLEVSAENVAFSGEEAQVVALGAGGLRLNEDRGRDVPAQATIYKAEGDVRFESDGVFAVGRNEKLSVAGALAIEAAEVAVGDVSALSLRVVSDRILLLGREAGPVLLQDGELAMDRGLDLVANDLSFSTTPEWDGVGARPTLATDDGAVRAPGPLTGFDVTLANPGGDALSAADFLRVVEAEGEQGEVETEVTVLDLRPDGPPAQGDPSSETVLAGAPVEALLPPRVRGGAPIVAREPVSAADVLAFLRCAPLSGEAPPDCPAPDPGRLSGTALATERALEAASLYRSLFGAGDRARADREAFAAAVDAYRTRRGVDRVTDGAELLLFLEYSPEHRPALEYLERLASLLVQLELLDIGPASDDARKELLARAVGETGSEGLSPASLLEAVRAHRIGLPRVAAR